MAHTDALPRSSEGHTRLRKPSWQVLPASPRSTFTPSLSPSPAQSSGLMNKPGASFWVTSSNKKH